MAHLDDVVLAEAHHRPGDLLEAVAEPRVLQADPQADRATSGHRGVIGGTHRVETGPRAETPVVHDLARPPDDPRRDEVARAHLPTRDTDPLGETVHDPLHRELRLIGAESAERTAHRVVGPDRDRLDIDRRHDVRARGVTSGPLEHLHADRGVGPGVSDHAHPQGGEPTVTVAAGGVLHPDRMPLGVHQERLLPTERGADRTVEQPGGERRLTLVRHVLLAAEGTPVADQLGHHTRRVDIEDAGDVVAVVPDPLPSGEDHETPEVNRVSPGHLAGERQRLAGRDREREGGLRLEEGVVDALGLEGLRDDVRRRLERLVDLTAHVGARRETIAIQPPHRVLGRLERLDRVRQRIQGTVGDLDEGGCPTGRRPGVGDDESEHIAEIAGATTDRDEHRPVLVDETRTQLARHVSRREDADHAGDRLGLGGVDREHIGAGVGREMHGAVQQTLGTHVVDEVALSEGQLVRLILDPAGADPAGTHRHRHLISGERLDRVEDLDVSGAPAEMSAEQTGSAVTGDRLAVGGLVEHGLGAHDDARGAEPALEGAVGGEGGSHAIPLGGVDTLERHDRCSLDPFEGGLARDPRLAVDEHSAAPALTRRRAAVLR